MSSMKHTKSPSGKTHRLTNAKGEYVTLRYRERPQFDDQVQGDLIRAYRTKTGDPTPIGRLGTFVDAALLDKDQTEPSLDYLRGYLAGLEVGAMPPVSETPALIRDTREKIARLEAAQRGYGTDPVNVGITATSYPGGAPTLPGAPPAAGAASIQINQVQPPQFDAAAEIARRESRLTEGVRRVRDAERNGW